MGHGTTVHTRLLYWLIGSVRTMGRVKLSSAPWTVAAAGSALRVDSCRGHRACRAVVTCDTLVLSRCEDLLRAWRRVGHVTVYRGCSDSPLLSDRPVACAIRQGDTPALQYKAS